MVMLDKVNRRRRGHWGSRLIHRGKLIRNDAVIAMDLPMYAAPKNEGLANANGIPTDVSSLIEWQALMPRSAKPELKDAVELTYHDGSYIAANTMPYIIIGISEHPDARLFTVDPKAG